MYWCLFGCWNCGYEIWFSLDTADCTSEVYYPQTRTEEVLLLLLITEALVSKSEFE